MSVSKLGVARMHHAFARATGDIRHRLWSLYWLVRLQNVTGQFVECGTRGGDSTRALLNGCMDTNSHLWSFDVEDCLGSVNDSFQHPYWTFQQKSSLQAAAEWALGPVDMVFIDTDHTFRTTRAEIAAWAPLVRPAGGCLVFHDYWLHDPGRDEHQGHGVKMAVDEWTDARPGEYRLETHDAGPDGDTGLAIIWRGK